MDALDNLLPKPTDYVVVDTIGPGATWGAQGVMSVHATHEEALAEARHLGSGQLTRYTIRAVFGTVDGSNQGA